MPLPPRPTSLDDVEFERRRPVEWFSPPVLARSGVKVVLSAVLGDYLDKREMQKSLPGCVVPSPTAADEVWVDFVADSGDGFNPTYTVAWCVSQRTIAPDGLDGEDHLPRGDFVIFGGDEVYPYASPKEYEDRFVGPYTTALPWTQGTTVGPDDGHPRLLAIPGNHDWYDGLTGFMRVFAQQGWIGGRKLAQTRSYFAVDLPGRYWLWGIDIGNDAYVDAAQIDYFRAAAEQMSDGDRLILCTAKPSWSNVGSDPHAYRNLTFVERHLVPNNDKKRVETILMVSGDKHYYAHHELVADDGSLVGDHDRRAKITAGGGGAFLSATHDLADDALVPSRVARSGPDGKDTTQRYQLQPATYPTRRQSWWLTFRALLLGWYNRVFLVVTAVLNLLLFAANASGLRTDDESFAEGAATWGYSDLLAGGFRSPATIILLLLLVALLIAFADAPRRFDGRLGQVDRLLKWLSLGRISLGGFTRVAMGVLHAAAHVAIHALVVLLAILALDSWSGLGFVLAVALFVTVVGGVAGSVVFGAYLVISLNGLRRHDTEAFSAFRYEGYKNFLRMKVTEGGVTVYPIGIPSTCSDWEADPTAVEPDASHIRPKSGTIEMELIEPPFTLR